MLRQVDGPATHSFFSSRVAETLAQFKVPTYVELTTDKLPRNASGKLLKRELRRLQLQNQAPESGHGSPR